MKSINLAGIYDRRTVDKARDNGITSLTFDFRPKSFNFIQQYVLEEILDGVESGLVNVNLHFENEADFVVTSIVEAIEKKGHACTLVFSDKHKKNYYEKFDRPFLVYYRDDSDFKSVLSSKLCQGVILKYDFLHELKGAGTLNNFLSNFYVYNPMDNIIGLELDWDSNIAATILDLVDFEFVTIPVNSKVEVCYRNVDGDKLQKQLHQLKQI
jgi:hypothetical protein